jgi:hypothetical protein
LRFLFFFFRTDCDANECKTTNCNNEYSHKLLFFGLLDLLRFAFIQRGNVLFWMHVLLKNKSRDSAPDCV